MTFWKVWVRTPALAAVAGSFALGLWGAVDWAPALAGACFAAFTAKAASMIIARRASESEPGQGSVLEFPRRPASGSRYDRAA